MGWDVIETDRAPRAIGTYSQAVRAGSLVFLSGQIPLDPATMALVSDEPRAQITQVFRNLQAVIEAAGGHCGQVVKLAVFLTDLAHFPLVNEVMAQFFTAPYPARSAIGVAALPRGALVEMDVILDLDVRS
ncbi:MAG: RidA family protein [Gammaproteobacteria bacterium]|nr:RidA family protein [Gammaproteobacteria bacterium]